MTGIKFLFRFDKDAIMWDTDMHTNELLIKTINAHLKCLTGLHSLNDIFDAFGIERKISGYGMIFDGPIELAYEKFDDHFDINVLTDPIEINRSILGVRK